MQTICRKTEPNPNAGLKHAFRPAPLRCIRILQIALPTMSCLFSYANAETSTPNLDPIDFLTSRQKTKDAHEADISNTPTQHLERTSAKTNPAQRPKDSTPFVTYTTTPLNFVAQLTDKSQHNSAIITANPGFDSIRRLWHAEITVPDTPDDDKSKENLLRAIEQIRSLQLKPADQPPQPVIAVGTIQPDSNEPNQPSPALQPQEAHAQNQIEPKTQVHPQGDNETQTQRQPDPQLQKQPKTGTQPVLPYEAVSEKTLQLLKDILQDPTKEEDTFQLAEILFAGERLKEAAILYQEAFKRMDPNRPEQLGNRAWILFQIGNCLREYDPETASKAYTRLIEQYPASLWTDLAKARNELILWYRKDKPQMLVAESKR